MPKVRSSNKKTKINDPTIPIRRSTRNIKDTENQLETTNQSVHTNNSDNEPNCPANKNEPIEQQETKYIITYESDDDLHIKT